MDVQQLRCFLAVAEELHFTRAAERLHLSTSPVSRSVKELERELGGALFLRRYHQVELTPLGQALVEPARRIVEQLDGFKQLAAQAIGSAARAVRIGATYLAPPAVVEQFVTLVETTFPDRPVEVAQAPSSELLPDLERGQLHAALIHVPVQQPQLAALVVARYTFWLVMRADDPLAGSEGLAVADLVDRTLTLGPPTPQPVAMQQLYADLRRAGVRKVHEMPDHDQAALAAHIRRSRGIALTLHPSAGGVARIYDDPAFALVPLLDDSVEFLLGLVWRRADAVEDDVVREIVDAAHAEWGHRALRV